MSLRIRVLNMATFQLKVFYALRIIYFFVSPRNSLHSNEVSTKKKRKFGKLFFFFDNIPVVKIRTASTEAVVLRLSIN